MTEPELCLMVQQLACPSADTLRRALAGTLPGEENESVAAHLESCPECLRVAEGLNLADGLHEELRAAAKDASTLHHLNELRDRLTKLWVRPSVASGRAQGSALDMFASAAGEEPGWLGHYRVRGHLGSGGMGTVFAAEDTKLQRAVAIKVLSRPDPILVDLMHRERTLLAALRHPHIVTVYDSGELADGRPYVVMEFVEGQTLDEHVMQHRPDAHRLVAILKDVAGAVGVAHALGIVHRDLKPENIKVTPAGEARVLDFGLAKRFSDAEFVCPFAAGGAADGAAATGIVGTRGYMSPEQAGGERVDARTDVFALGTILHRLLPAARQPDLAAIIEKSTATSASARYADAAALAADLDDWLSDRPVVARHAPAGERAWRWVRRRPTLAALVAVSLLALVALPAAIIGALYNARLAVSLHDTEQARQRAEDAERRVRQAAYFHRILLAGQEWRDSQVGRARELLDECDPEFRGWEWHFLSRVCNPPTARFEHPGEVYTVAVSADGSLIASGCLDSAARLWDARTGVVRHTLRGHTERIYRLAFDPDGKRLVTASSDGTVKVWDAADGRELFNFTGHKPGVRTALFSPDGRWIASAGKDGRVKLWDPATGTVKLDLDGVLNGHDHPLCFDPSGRWLAYACTGPIRIWDTNTGELISSLPGPTKTTVRGMAIDPGGTRLAVAGGDERVVIWQSPLGPDPKPRELLGHVNTVYSVAWSPDGAVLASGGADTTIKLWDPASGKLIDQLQGHDGRVIGLAWAPNGRDLVSASTDRSVRVWDTQSRVGARRLDAGTTVKTLAWSPDGQRLYVGCFQPAVRCLDIPSGRRRFDTSLERESKLAASAVSPDGRFVAVAGQDLPVTVLDAETGAVIARFEGHTDVVQIATFSPDSRFLATADRARSLRIWDMMERREAAPFDSAAGDADGGWMIGDRSVVRLLRSVPLEAQVNHGVTWSPDGRSIASWMDRSQVVVWDGDTGKARSVLRGHTHGMNSISWSPDGRRLATASSDLTVRIWDPAAGEPTFVLGGFPQGVNAIAWSPDGRHLAAGSQDGTILIWDGLRVAP